MDEKAKGSGKVVSGRVRVCPTQNCSRQTSPPLSLSNQFRISNSRMIISPTCRVYLWRAFDT